MSVASRRKWLIAAVRRNDVAAIVQRSREPDSPVVLTLNAAEILLKQFACAMPELSDLKTEATAWLLERNYFTPANEYEMHKRSESARMSIAITVEREKRGYKNFLPFEALDVADAVRRLAKAWETSGRGPTRTDEDALKPIPMARVGVYGIGYSVEEFPEGPMGVHVSVCRVDQRKIEGAELTGLKNEIGSVLGGAVTAYSMPSVNPAVTHLFVEQA